MSGAARAIDALFADPNIAVDAVYQAEGGQPVMVRVIARRPDQVIGLGEARIRTETAIFEVRASEVTAPRPGDRLAVGAITYVVQGEPVRKDTERLVWTLNTRSS